MTQPQLKRVRGGEKRWREKRTMVNGSSKKLMVVRRDVNYREQLRCNFFSLFLYSRPKLKKPNRGDYNAEQIVALCSVFKQK